MNDTVKNNRIPLFIAALGTLLLIIVGFYVFERQSLGASSANGGENAEQAASEQGWRQFFRDPAAFSALEQQIPALFAEKGPNDAVRVWVPGCATGEEAAVSTRATR